MNRDQKKAVGILLCVIGFWFYCQQSLLTGYLGATRNDFTHLYLAGYLAERTGNFFNAHLLLHTKTYLQIPYGLNPFVYPPFFALLLIPLSKFSYDMAWFLFTALSQTAYFAAMAILVRILRRDEDEPAVFWWGILIALSACFYPLMKTYSAGQMNAFMLLALVSGAYLLAKGRDIEAGFVFGLSAAIKVTPAFLLIYCCWTKRWRAAIAGAVVLILTVMISLAMLGVDVHAGFLAAAKDMGYGSSTWSQFKQTYHIDPFNQAPSALWHRLFSTTATEQFGTIQGVANLPLLAKILSYASAMAVIAILLRFTRRNAAPFSLIDYASWTIAMLLIPSLLWDHYMAQAIFAVAVALQIALEKTTQGVFWLGMAIAILAIPFYHQQPAFMHGWMTLFMSIKLFGLIGLWGYLIRRRNEDAAPVVDDANIIPEI